MRVRHVSCIDCRHGLNENEIEDAVRCRKPIAARALYTLIDRRLKADLGWPDRTFDCTATNKSSTGNIVDGNAALSARATSDKLDRHEPLPCARRVRRQCGSTVSYGNTGLSREKSQYRFDEHGHLPTQTIVCHRLDGLTADTGNQLTVMSRLEPRKLFHDNTQRQSSTGTSHRDVNDESMGVLRRTLNGHGLVPSRTSPIRPTGHEQQTNVVVVQSKPLTSKTRSQPSSLFDYTSPTGFHVTDESPGSRTPKPTNRPVHVEQWKKHSSNTSIRHHPGRFSHVSLADAVESTTGTSFSCQCQRENDRIVAKEFDVSFACQLVQ
jgi:hypothetical protein